jgi:hypothetical protein
VIAKLEEPHWTMDRSCEPSRVKPPTCAMPLRAGLLREKLISIFLSYHIFFLELFIMKNFKHLQKLKE